MFSTNFSEKLAAVLLKIKFMKNPRWCPRRQTCCEMAVVTWGGGTPIYWLYGYVLLDLRIHCMVFKPFSLV